jgi:hypothetical protein
MNDVLKTAHWWLSHTHAFTESTYFREEENISLEEDISDSTKYLAHLAKQRDLLQAKLMERMRTRNSSNAKHSNAQTTIMGSSRKWWHPPSALDADDPLMVYTAENADSGCRHETARN